MWNDINALPRLGILLDYPHCLLFSYLLPHIHSTPLLPRLYALPHSVWVIWPSPEGHISRERERQSGKWSGGVLENSKQFCSLSLKFLPFLITEMLACVSSSPSPFRLSSDIYRSPSAKPASLSWSSSFPHFNFSINSISTPLNPLRKAVCKTCFRFLCHYCFLLQYFCCAQF